MPQFPHDKALSAIKGIVDAIAEHGDLIEICVLVRQAVHALFPCQQVTILRNDAPSQSFSLAPALNQGTTVAHLDLQIPYKECSWQEIIHTRAPLLIDSATHATEPSEGEKILSGGKPCLCAVVPIVWGRIVLGVIHTVCREAQPQDSELAQVEELAALLAVAFERSRVYATSEAADDAAQQWREKYFSVVTLIDRALLVVDAGIDIIYESNGGAAELTGYSQGELNAMLFSSLFAGDTSPNLRECATEGRPASHPLHLIRKDGTQLQVVLRAVRITAADRPRYIVLVSPAEDSGARQSEAQSTASKLSPAEIDPDKFEESLDALLDECGDFLRATYGSVHTLSADGRTLQIYRIQQFQESSRSAEEVTSYLETGPYQAALQAEGVLTCTSLTSTAVFAQLRTSGQGAGYESFITSTFSVAGQKLGVLTYFFEDERTFTESEVDLFALLNRQIALLFYCAQTKRQLLSQVEHNSRAVSVIAALPGLLSIEELVERLAEQLYHHINFDLFSITLLNFSSEKARSYCIASDAFAAALKGRLSAQKLKNSDFWGFFFDSDSGAERDKSSVTLFSDTLHSKISVLLIEGEQYLGNLALGALAQNAFSRDDVAFLRSLAPAVSITVTHLLRLTEDARVNAASGGPYKREAR